MINYLKFIRPLNCLITFTSVFVAAFISAGEYFPLNTVLYAALSASLVAAAGNVINDYFDFEIDKIAHPDRPLINGKISKKYALNFYFLLNLAALIISYFISTIAFGIVLLSIILLLLYSFSLKKIILFSNYIIAWLTGMVFIYGGLVTGNVSAAVIPALFAFIINFIREILKDIQDIKGDLTAGVVTFPAKYGSDKAIIIINALTLILILITFHPFIFSYYKIEYFVFVMVIVNPLLIYFLKSVNFDRSEKNLSRMSILLKLNMVFGLIAIYLGK